MMFFKNAYNGFIESISTGYGQTEISEQEYNAILDIIRNAPAAPNGFVYKLRADTLEWELVEMPPIEPEPPTEEEALTRYANALTGANDPDLISAAETLITERIKEES